jgi:peptidylprolyl isomerase
MTKSIFRLLSLSIIAAATIAQAQSTSHTTTGHSTVHHSAVTKPAACSTAVPDISAKIPALPSGVSTCPEVLYSLKYVDTVIGKGDLAKSRMYYTVHYTGYLADGTKFDSSVDRGEPITFPYGARQVIPGWDTGFEGMHVGGKRRLFVPYQLAYGEAGRPPVIPAKSLLIFDIELISQSPTPPAPKPAPKPATAPPATPPVPPSGATKPATPGSTTEPQKAAPAPAPASSTAAPAAGATKPK